MFHLIGPLSPVVHQKRWDLIRVPLRKINDRYVVYVADGLVRYYDEDTLPDFLKVKMAMILAASNHRLESEVRLQRMTVYSNPMSSDFDDIGWRVSETYFCLIVAREALEEMKGETQHGTDA